MKKLTRNGICYDFNVSPYRFKTEYGVTYVFSSQLHTEKFEMMLFENRQQICDSLENRFKIMNIKLTLLPDIALYRKIEKRGFLLIDENGEKICQIEKTVLDGNNLTMKN